MSENWQIKHFNQLTRDELYDCLKLRIDVFVVEQTCYYPDLDDLDRHPKTLHIFRYIDGKIAAYLRILPKGTTYPDYISIGRVIIAPDFRGKALGHEIIKLALATIEQYFANQNIKISAQKHLEKFYQKHGFKTCTEMYLEDGIEHIGMKLVKVAPHS
ncbi:GNAT family N-acetyltransferase [Thalassotalea sp. LPB0316]|uniref:GNAT family N-acetyltransferase n=1 Tax=Thalassotalea sp. LPB0316 TaxID=2769490 RepID=UPI001869525C|nr:GNAT family N-acetyltransferase [Thalassotalea sp. LPB0316]QOL24621.1 GNAT family N-acetyltransferase [Thalassotalea sp. LPB0316]